jgi:dCTP deaminase
MILSDITIRGYLDSGRIRVTPKVEEHDIRPAGIRLHLAAELLVATSPATVDPRSGVDHPFDRITMGGTGHVLAPGAFALGSSVERIQMTVPLVGLLDGRSTLARLGLVVHAGSSVIDGNHDEPRSVVLELKNVGPLNIVVSVGLPIAMLAFVTLSERIGQSSGAQYASQDGVAPPDLVRDIATRRSR